MGLREDVEKVLNEELISRNGQKPKNKVISSGFQYILNSNELDGLSKQTDSGENMLVESVIPKDEWKESKDNVEGLLISTNPNAGPITKENVILLEEKDSIPANID